MQPSASRAWDSTLSLLLHRESSSKVSELDGNDQMPVGEAKAIFLEGRGASEHTDQRECITPRKIFLGRAVRSMEGYPVLSPFLTHVDALAQLFLMFNSFGSRR